MPAYFAFAQKAARDPQVIRLFVFKLEDAAKIALARAVLADTEDPRRRVQGTIVPSRVPYNPEWSFHLDPATVGFFDLQIEVCDANPTYVEDHLDEIGGSTLPRSFWCPWRSHLIAEVTHLVDAETESLAI